MKKSQKNLLQCCAELGEGDGQNPREDRKFYSRQKKRCVSRKNKQLCQQVVQAVNLTFAQIDSDVIASLYAKYGVPAPNTSRVLIYVTTQMKVSSVEIQREISRYNGRLRREVAEMIHRRKVPSLAFMIEMNR